MPPRKRARQGSPGNKSRKGAKVAWANVDPTRQSSRSMRGIGGHAAQLQKTGETLMAPTRRKKASNDLDISDSEENPMAPLQLKRRKEKASTPKSSVEPDSSRPESECAHLHIARPSDRFGFKPSQSQATHPIGHNHKEAGSEVTEQGLENHSGSGDLDDLDEWGKTDNDFGEYDDGPALTDSLPGGDGDDLMEFDESQPGCNDGHTDTIPYDVLKHHQVKNRCRKAPSLTHLSSNSHGHTLTRNAFGRSKSPHQYSPKHMPRRRMHLEKGHLQRLVLPMGVVIPPPMDHLVDAPRLGFMIPPPVNHLIDAPRLSQRLSLLAQGLRVQAGVMITLSTDRLLGDTPRLNQQPFSLAQDLHIRVHPVDHLLDIPCHGHHIGKPLDPITRGLIPLFQAVLTLVLVVPHLNQGTKTNQ
ncbi:hypothetical protein F4604DRAFT_1936493 [Suillus subluteus]|nr:hypothetical protein F4604DRAFT_1936493 [Suillus subluteus]